MTTRTTSYNKPVRAEAARPVEPARPAAPPAPRTANDLPAGLRAHDSRLLTSSLAPMPELTPEALRAEIARIAPARIPALTQHLVEATTNAQQTQSLAPLKASVHSWAVFVAIERHPQRAARLRELERILIRNSPEVMVALEDARAGGNGT
ncbi:hypothetical protein ABZ723_28995 [Streptomyces sp. NPDC006700]|uniref:hypothetical protein n=1 Tax=Streptomyces sp. NPDC006700 TaxID=3154479 RepID=UPI0033FA2BB8